MEEAKPQTMAEEAASEAGSSEARAEAEAPEVTVLITAHNKAESIRAALRAVRAQDFPMERVEVLLVDDRSTDGTAEAAMELGLASLRVVRVADPPPAGLTARQVALDLGLREARGEIVCITDGDARVPREWLRELVGHLSFRDGAVAAPVIFGGNHHAIARFQSIESLVTFTLCRLLDRQNLKSSLSTASVAIRRSVYLESGGFAKTGFCSAEGVALSGLLRGAGWSVRYLIDPIVQTADSGSLVGLIARGRRRARAAAPLLTVLWLLIIVSNVMLLGWAVLGSTPLWLALPVLALRYGAGLMVFGALVGQYRAYSSLGALLLFEPFLTYIGTCVYVSLVFRPRWRWAGVEYGRGGRIGAAAPREAAGRSEAEPPPANASGADPR